MEGLPYQHRFRPPRQEGTHQVPLWNVSQDLAPLRVDGCSQGNVAARS